MHACQTVVMSAILCAVAGCNGVVSATQAEEKARVLVNEASLIEADQARALLSVFQQDENLAFIAGGGVGDQSGVIYQWNGQELIEEQTPVRLRCGGSGAMEQAVYGLAATRVEYSDVQTTVDGKRKTPL